MDLIAAKILAIELMAQHGLLQKGWSFEFDSSKRRFGVCVYNTRVIGLSSQLVELNSEAEVRDVILHEIAHALVGFKHHHDRVWKAKAIEIGCKGKRLCSTKEVNTPESRYIAVCPNCGHTFKRHKMTDNMRKNNSTCGYCDKKHNPLYRLTWVANPKF